MAFTANEEQKIRQALNLLNNLQGQTGRTIGSLDYSGMNYGEVWPESDKEGFLVVEEDNKAKKLEIEAFAQRLFSQVRAAIAGTDQHYGGKLKGNIDGTPNYVATLKDIRTGMFRTPATSTNNPGEMEGGGFVQTGVQGDFRLPDCRGSKFFDGQLLSITCARGATAKVIAYSGQLILDVNQQLVDRIDLPAGATLQMVLLKGASGAEDYEGKNNSVVHWRVIGGSYVSSQNEYKRFATMLALTSLGVDVTNMGTELRRKDQDLQQQINTKLPASTPLPILGLNQGTFRMAIGNYQPGNDGWVDCSNQFPNAVLGVVITGASATPSELGGGLGNIWSSVHISGRRFRILNKNHTFHWLAFGN